MNELLAEYAALEPRLRLYPKSRKESGIAFGPGRQAALAELMVTKAKIFEEHGCDVSALSLDLLKACLHSANA